MIAVLKKTITALLHSSAQALMLVSLQDTILEKIISFAIRQPLEESNSRTLSNLKATCKPLKRTADATHIRRIALKQFKDVIHWVPARQDVQIQGD